MKRLRIVTSLTAVLLIPVLLLAACGGTGGGNDDGQNTQETADEQEISEDSVGEETREDTARVMDVTEAEHLDGRIDKTFTISDDLTMTVEQIMTARDVFPSAGEEGSYSMGDSSQVYFDVYVVAEWTGKDGTDPAEVLYVGAVNRETGEVSPCTLYSKEAEDHTGLTTPAVLTYGTNILRCEISTDLLPEAEYEIFVGNANGIYSYDYNTGRIRTMADEYSSGQTVSVGGDVSIRLISAFDGDEIKEAEAGYSVRPFDGQKFYYAELSVTNRTDSRIRFSDLVSRFYYDDYTSTVCDAYGTAEDGSGLVNDTSISPGQTRTIYIAASEKETAVLTPILISYCLNGNLSYYHIVWD